MLVSNTRAKISDPGRILQLADIEAGEAVLDVDLPGPVVGDAADRGALGGEEFEDDLKGPPLGVGEGSGGGWAHSETSGATITQRWGSSPSL